MSFRGTDEHKQYSRRGQDSYRNNRNRYLQNVSTYDNQRGRSYNGSNYRGGRGRNYNSRQYNNYNTQNMNNNTRSNYNMNQNHSNNTPNELQVNSSRFSRPKNTGNVNTSTGYKSRRNFNNYSSNTDTYKPHNTYSFHNSTPLNFDAFAFPNDWDHNNRSDIRPYHNFKGWKASKPKIKYYTSNGAIYPDRVGVPQICSKGYIDNIINTGCTFASEHFQIHPSLLPGNITLMIFRKENSAFLQRHGNPMQNVQDGSQIRLKYSLPKFFQILWINAKQNKHFGIEIPELGWKLAAIEKFKTSMRRNVGGTLQMALNNEYINQDKYNELIQYFKALNEDFQVKNINSDHEFAFKNELNTQSEHTNKNQEIMNEIETCTDNLDDSKSITNDENDEDLIRNAKEATEFFNKNKFKLNNAEPRFTKIIEENISAFYLENILPNELKNLYKTAIKISDLLSYEWRIGVSFGENKSEIYIEFYSGNKENRFEVWTQLKQKLNIDKEGDDNTYGAENIGKECGDRYFDLMKKIYTDQKLGLLQVHKNEKEYMDNCRLLKQLNNCVPVLYFPQKVGDNPYVRPSKFKNNWWDCCVKYNYPGRDILDKVKLNVDTKMHVMKYETHMTTKDDLKVDKVEYNDEGDTQSCQNDIDELTESMAQHIIETLIDDKDITK